MKNPTNEYYSVAVNSDCTYPPTRDSHVKQGQPYPEIQNGYLTTAHVIPDGHIIPHEMPVPPIPPGPTPPTTNSLYRLGKIWNDIEGMTWQAVDDQYTW